MCPEKPERIRALAPEFIFDKNEGVVFPAVKQMDSDTLELAHSPDYVSEVRQAFHKKRRFLDAGDTRVTHDLFDQSLRSVSLACSAVGHVQTGKSLRAFCATRPPGHHANAIRGMGFCVFNNIAVAARYAQKRHGVDRVLIVDWDNDPGNGTQEIFWDDPTVFTLSFHQENLFPETGKTTLIGRGEGEGFNRNVPLPLNTTAKDYHQMFSSVMQQVVARFKPQAVFLAAGFDAHHQDPQSKMPLDETDFKKMTQVLLEVIEPYTNGSLVSLLEGGYNISALARSVKAHCGVLAETASSHRTPALSGHSTA